MQSYVFIFSLIILVSACSNLSVHDEKKKLAIASVDNQLPMTKELLYSSQLKNKNDTQDWIMEGPGKVRFKNGWMQMFSPNEEMHHVYWCPVEFPSNFIARWKAQSLNNDAGLVIVFFAATGSGGEDIFDSPENQLLIGSRKL